MTTSCTPRHRAASRATHGLQLLKPSTIPPSISTQSIRHHQTGLHSQQKQVSVKLPSLKSPMPGGPTPHHKRTDPPGRLFTGIRKLAGSCQLRQTRDPALALAILTFYTPGSLYSLVDLWLQSLQQEASEILVVRAKGLPGLGHTSSRCSFPVTPRKISCPGYREIPYLPFFVVVFRNTCFSARVFFFLWLSLLGY